jgi:vesicle coat complex subunit
MYLKKMAYLLAAMLVKPGDTLGLLMNNTLTKDLQSDNLFVIMVALTMLRYFLSSDIIPNILPIIKKLTKHHTSIIRKKSYLVLLNIYQIENSYINNMKALTSEALEDVDGSVAFAGVSILKVLAPSNPHDYKDLVKRLT